MSIQTRSSKFIAIIIGVVLTLALLVATGWAWASGAFNPPPTSAQTTPHATAATAPPPTRVPAQDSSSQNESSPTQSPSPATAAQCEDLALEAAQIMTTWNARGDFNQTSSELRARHLMVPDRAAQVQAPERPATGSEWLTAAERHATSEPTLELNKAIESDPDHPTISVIATWRWKAPGHNDLVSPERRAFFFTCTEHNGQLKINDYTWQGL